MEIFILKSTAILGILWLGYILFLERENMHRFKRFYLLSAILAAICIPLITFTEVVYIGQLDNTILFQNEIIPFEIPQNFESIEVPFWTLKTTLWSIYGIGALIFGIRFIKNLFRIIKTIKQNEKLEQNQITFVLLKQFIIPHTFFKYIFLNKLRFKNNDLPKEVILHEETHAKQKHSLDVFFIELMQVIFWFQPFIWLYKKHIKLNHEFLADQAVLNQGFEPANYQNTLLSFSSNHQDYSLINAINYSSIKKRFTVMKTQTPQTKKWLLSLLILPVLAILTYSFSEKEIVEKEVFDNEIIDSDKLNTAKNIKEELEDANALQVIYSEKASEELMKEYKSFIKKYNETKIIYADAYERAIIIYDQLMSDTQRASVEKYPKRIFPKSNLSKVTPRKPTKAQFEAFKNKKEYAIWIDNRHVPNSELDNYDYGDFAHVSGSHVYKNARSEKFPQPNQYHLYTEQGFKTIYGDAQLRQYNKATKAYSNAIREYLKGLQTDNSELKILKAKADAIYKTFSAEEIKKNNIKLTPPVPKEKTYENSLPESKILVNGKICNQCTMTFEDLKKLEITTSSGVEITSYTAKVLGEKSVTVKGNSINESILNILSGNPEAIQIMNIKSGKKLIKNAVLINIKRQQKTPTKKEIADYNAWAKKINNQINKAKSNKNVQYPIIKKKSIERYISIYSRMSEKQKANAEAFPNIPPPPPPPPTKVKPYENGNKKTLKQIIKDTPKNVKSGYEVLDNGESHYYTIYKGKKTYYNKDGYITDVKGNVLPPPPPAPKKTNTKGGPNANYQITDTNCLEFPKSFTTKNNNTLQITCIDNYSNNKLEIFDRFGNLIYSKNNYKNNWDGTVDKEYAIDSTNKIKTDTYYYAFSSDNLEKPKVGYLLINKEHTNTVIIKDTRTNKKSKGGPNPDYYFVEDNTTLTKTEYIKKYKQYEALRHTKPHFLKKSKADKKLMSDLWLELRQIHIYKLTKSEKESLKMPVTPFAPYVKINLDGKSYYKLSNKLNDKESKSGMAFSFSKVNHVKRGLDLIDDNYPVIIPIENYKLEPIKKEDYETKKRQVYITVSKDGKYGINKDNTLKEFEPLNLNSLEQLISKLSEKDIENTFIFSSTKDYKKFRNKPSKSLEYQDDIEVNIIKDDVRFIIQKYKGKFHEFPSYQSALDNSPNQALKTHVKKLGDLFKKYGITNLTL